VCLLPRKILRISISKWRLLVHSGLLGTSLRISAPDAWIWFYRLVIPTATFVCISHDLFTTCSTTLSVISFWYCRPAFASANPPPTLLCHWFSTFLVPIITHMDRAYVIAAAANGKSSTVVKLCHGVTVPRGSILGPKFIAYTEDIDDIFQSHGLHHHCFADDTQMYIATPRSRHTQSHHAWF